MPTWGALRMEGLLLWLFFGRLFMDRDVPFILLGGLENN